MFPEAVPGVDQRRQGLAYAVTLQCELYVPAKADMPSPAQKQHQCQHAGRGQRKKARRSASGERSAAAADCRGDTDADRRLQNAAWPAAAGQQHGGDETGEDQSRPAAQPSQAGAKPISAERVGTQRTQGQNQSARMQTAQHQLDREQDARVHQKIHG